MWDELSINPDCRICDDAVDLIEPMRKTWLNDNNRAFLYGSRPSTVEGSSLPNTFAFIFAQRL